MFNTISIIGCGLIGSSILRAIQKRNLAKEVRVFDLSRETISYLKKENISSNISLNIRQCVKNSDLVIIATPLSSYKEIILSIKELKEEVIQYSAGGLRDFTRIAASNPLMWRDIFLDNNENISKGIDSFIDKLQELKKALNDKNGEKLYQIFNSTKEVRKDIIKAGQETSMPDFGRKKD